MYKGLYILHNRIAIPCDNILEWGFFFEEKENCVVKQEIFDGVLVSTVFLGINHAWRGEDPILFETMVFGGKMDQYQDRCSTWGEAEEMHEKAVMMVKALSFQKEQWN